MREDWTEPSEEPLLPFNGDLDEDAAWMNHILAMVQKFTKFP
jgi:hypothetical protein